MKSKLLITIMIFSTLKIYSQIEIWLYDGKMFNTRGYRIDTEFVYFIGKKHNIAIPKNEVFAIIDLKDTIILNDTVQNPYIYLSYLHGLNAGYKFNNPLIIGSNFIIGFTSAIVLPSLGYSGVYSTIPPIISIFTFGIIPPKKIPDSSIFSKKHFEAGYIQAAQKKKFINALEGSLLGYIIGTATFYVIAKQ